MMKYLVAATIAVMTYVMVPALTPAVAQNNISQMCRNKYAIDSKRVTTDGQRQEANKKVQACIKSGGKS
jgi:hypothetical protein